MSIIKNSHPLKVFSTACFLFIRLTLFSQVSHQDSLLYFNYLREDSILGTDMRGTTVRNFIAKDAKGNLFTNNSLRSKITFINFWFEACHPCIAELPALQKFYTNNKSKKDFQFISITFEQDSTIERVRKQYNLTYPIYHLSHDSCRRVLVRSGYPTNFIVDRAGKIVYSATGGPLDPVIADKFLNYFIQAELEKLLK